jgi:AraC-like DNA-binding protein/quercetin dioxygenase-like cupin family protein
MTALRTDVSLGQLPSRRPMIGGQVSSSTSGARTHRPITHAAQRSPSGHDDHESNIAVLAQSSRYFECSPTWTLPSRTTPDYQLWLVIAGELTIRFEERTRLGLGAASVILIPPGVVHAAEQHPARHLRAHVIHFTALAFGLPALQLWQPRAVTAIPMRCWTRLTGCADEICHELDERRDGSRLLANAAISRLLGLLQRHAPDCTQHSIVCDSRLSASVTSALTYVREHYAENVQLQHLADAAHVTAKHLDYAFRRSVGLTPGQYLRRYRLERAKQLLGETDCTIREIANGVGFTDSYYFSRAFRRAEGLSPLQYRTSLRTDTLR